MKFVALVAIIPNEMEEKGVEIAKNAGAGAVTIISGKNIGLKEKKIFFGVTLEEAMSILLFILPRKLSLKVLRALKNELNVEDTENSSIIFTLPLEHVVGINKEELHKFESEIKTIL
ncbi:MULTISPECIES: transcriptional regulator [Nitratiruptor]|uniref:Nitrogen regulatory protein P-II family n=1 Tax=Nitratiruptor tergarcus DSM 16512 TaxID=1069081 RepID=A0A1W1WTU3_9BACT|nr:MULTISPECIES: transcriptional regulator [Nitratiruptor]BCD62328.1 hypothetical protein NitYY0813_C1202 [Nitratiruptor sp. YY08-13]BCD66264.1 hypothetical protein NitYY0826_C1204 [Nitratiruptor sp. YY08-26]SMC09738.1 hypothetical protein SAMN05660197_1560 [Nitratiruptor tergarcus DSM 16512]